MPATSTSALSCIWDPPIGLWFGAWRAGSPQMKGYSAAATARHYPAATSAWGSKGPSTLHPAHPSQNPSPLDMPSKSLCSTPVWPGRSANIQQQYQVKSVKWGITWKVYWQIHGLSLNILHLEQVNPGKLYGNWRADTWYYTREDTDSW